MTKDFNACQDDGDGAMEARPLRYQSLDGCSIFSPSSIFRCFCQIRRKRYYIESVKQRYYVLNLLQKGKYVNASIVQATQRKRNTYLCCLVFYWAFQGLFYFFSLSL